MILPLGPQWQKLKLMHGTKDPQQLWIRFKRNLPLESRLLMLKMKQKEFKRKKKESKRVVK